MDEPRSDMDEPVKVNLSPEEAMEVLLRATKEADVDAAPPVGGWIDDAPS